MSLYCTLPPNLPWKKQEKLILTSVISSDWWTTDANCICEWTGGRNSTCLVPSINHVINQLVNWRDVQMPRFNGKCCVFFVFPTHITQVHCTEGVERRRSFHFCCCCLFLFSLLMLLILLPLLLLLLSMLLNSLCNTFGVPGFEPETRATADRCAANELHACLFPTVISAIFFFFYKVKKKPEKN